MTIKLTLNSITYNCSFTQYPGGERGFLIDKNLHCLIDSQLSEGIQIKATISCNYKQTNDLFDTLLVYNALASYGLTNIHLDIPYMPAAREDRPEIGRSFGLQVVASVLNTCDWKTITCHDVHSDVAHAFFKPGVFKSIPQHMLLARDISKIVADSIRNSENICLLSPDAGAIKKANQIIQTLGNRVPLLRATKKRDISTGNLSDTNIPVDVDSFKNIIIVDDICDGGRTFLNLADEIKKVNPMCNLHLVVTHGIFSAGRTKLEAAFKTVIAYNQIDNW